MNKIIKIKESEFKNIIENTILKEQEYNPFNDPKAHLLMKFLWENEPDKEFSVGEINLREYAYYNLDLYEIGKDRAYVIATDEEADDGFYNYMDEFIDEVGIGGFNEDFIMNYVESEWFEDALRESMEFYIEDIRNEKSTDPKKWKNRLEEEMELSNVGTEEEYLEKLIDDAGDPVEDFRSNYGDKEFNKTIVRGGLFDKDKLIEGVKERDGRGSFSNYDGEEHYFEGYYIYRIN